MNTVFVPSVQSAVSHESIAEAPLPVAAYSIWKINKRMAKEVLPSKAVLTLAVHAMGSSGKVEERTK